MGQLVWLTEEARKLALYQLRMLRPHLELTAGWPPILGLAFGTLNTPLSGHPASVPKLTLCGTYADILRPNFPQRDFRLAAHIL